MEGLNNTPTPRPRINLQTDDSFSILAKYLGNQVQANPQRSTNKTDIAIGILENLVNGIVAGAATTASDFFTAIDRTSDALFEARPDLTTKQGYFSILSNSLDRTAAEYYEQNGSDPETGFLSDLKNALVMGTGAAATDLAGMAATGMITSTIGGIAGGVFGGPGGAVVGKAVGRFAAFPIWALINGFGGGIRRGLSDKEAGVEAAGRAALALVGGQIGLRLGAKFARGAQSIAGARAKIAGGGAIGGIFADAIDINAELEKPAGERDFSGLVASMIIGGGLDTITGQRIMNEEFKARSKKFEDQGFPQDEARLKASQDVINLVTTAKDNLTQEQDASTNIEILNSYKIGVVKNSTQASAAKQKQMSIIDDLEKQLFDKTRIDSQKNVDDESLKTYFNARRPTNMDKATAISYESRLRDLTKEVNIQNLEDVRIDSFIDIESTAANNAAKLNRQWYDIVTASVKKTMAAPGNFLKDKFPTLSGLESVVSDPLSKRIVGGIRRTQEDWQINIAELSQKKDFNTKFNRLKKDDLKQFQEAGEKISDSTNKIFEDLSSKKDNQAFEKAQLEARKQIDAIKNPKVKEAMDAWFDGVAPAIFQRAIEANVKTASRMAFYWPRVLKQEVYNDMTVEMNSFRDWSQTNAGKKAKESGDFAILSSVAKEQLRRDGNAFKALEHMVATGQAKNLGEALIKLDRYATDSIFSPNGNLEKGRTLDLPTTFYESNPKQIVSSYIIGSSKRIAEAKTFGSGFDSQTNWAIDDLRILRQKNKKEAALVEQGLLSLTGAIYRHPKYSTSSRTRAMANAYTSFQVGTKIGLGINSTLANALQPFISLGEISNSDIIKSVVRGYTKQGTGLSEARIVDSMRQRLEVFDMAEGHATGKIGKGFEKFSEKATTVFSFFNRVNAYVTASTAPNFMREMHVKAKAGSAPAREMLTRFGVDFRKKELNKQDEDRFSFNFVNRQQLLRDVASDPLMSMHPRFKVLWLFKKFGLKQVQLIGNTMRNSIRDMDMVPLLRLGARGMIGGELIKSSKSLLTQLISGEKSDKESVLEFIERSPEGTDWLKRSIENYAVLGAFGMISDLIDADDAQDSLDKFVFLATPVILSDLGKMTKEMSRALGELETFGFDGVVRRALPRAAGAAGPIARAGGRRLRTERQQEDIGRSRKGRKIKEILKLKLDKRSASNRKAVSLTDQWNQANPGNKIKRSEVTLAQARKRERLKLEKRKSP